MKMNKTSLSLILLLLIYLLSACKQTAQLPAPQSSAPYDTEESIESEPDNTVAHDSENYDDETVCVNLVDVFPNPDMITNISVVVSSPNSIFGGVGPSARATDAQAEQIIGILRQLDMTCFEPCGRENANGLLLQLYIETVTDSRSVQVLSPIYGASDEDMIYIVFPAIHEGSSLTSGSVEDALEGMERFERETEYFKGPRGTFSFADLNQACSDIMSDDTDLLNTGVVYLLGSQEPWYAVVKGNWAYAQYMLDGAITTINTYGDPQDIGYDVRIAAGASTYFLNTSSGHVRRERDDQFAFSKLENSWLSVVCSSLGIVSSAADTGDTKDGILTITIEHRYIDDPFEISRGMVVATDEGFSNTLHPIRIVQVNNRYEYTFAADADIDVVFIRPPIAYMPVEIDPVSVVPVIGATAATADGNDWFTITSVSFHKDSEEAFEIVVSIIPFQDFLPRYPRLSTGGVPIDVLSSLDFNETDVFESGEFRFRFSANSENDARRLLESATLVIGHALMRVPADDLIFSASAGTHFLLSD